MQARFDLTGAEGDLQGLLVAETEYASTGEGQLAARAKALAGLDGPGGLPSQHWNLIADNGVALSGRNLMIAGAVRHAAVIGDAFHASARERLDGGVLPAHVRGPKALERFLELHTDLIAGYTHEVREVVSEITALDALLVRVGASFPDPAATYACGVPRSVGEKQAWMDRLGERREHAGEWHDDRVDSAADSIAVLAAFDRSNGQFHAAMTEPPNADEPGFVGRVLGSDGSLSDDVYVTFQRNRWEALKVFPVRPVTPAPDRYGRVDTAGVCVAPGRGRAHLLDAPTGLVRAEEPTWNRFVGTTPTNFEGVHVYMRTAGQRQEHNFEDFRHELALEGGHPFPDNQPGGTGGHHIARPARNDPQQQPVSTGREYVNV